MNYYECHITIEPVFDKRLEKLKEVAAAYEFKVADLLMVKRKEDTPERSKFDTFMTSRNTEKGLLWHRADELIKTLQKLDYKVFRMKLEHCFFDQRYS